MAVYQLVYKSISSPSIQADDIKNILEKALMFNELNDITGCLVKFRSEFLQVLEGENADVIQELYTKIRKDSRHNSVQLISSGFKDFRDYVF